MTNKEVEGLVEMVAREMAQATDEEWARFTEEVKEHYRSEARQLLSRIVKHIKEDQMPMAGDYYVVYNAEDDSQYIFRQEEKAADTLICEVDREATAELIIVAVNTYRRLVNLGGTPVEG